MGSKSPQTPQQKKALSLAKDRGGYFFNNQKAARKAVPIRKALESRRIRHQNNQALSQAEVMDEARQDLIESSARQNVARKGGWRKGKSIPLGEVIANTLTSRVQRIGRKKRSQTT